MINEIILQMTKQESEIALLLIGISAIIQIIEYTLLEIIDIYQERKNKNENN